MTKQLLFILCAIFGSTQFARAGESLDLRSIQHKFVELGLKEERHHIVDQAQLRTFWRRFSSEPEPKSVNLDKFDVVIFLMGTQPSGGYSAAIESIERAQKQSADNIVHVLLCHPPSNEPQMAEVTSPYAVKVIPNVKGRVVWKSRVQVTGSKGCR